MAVENSVSFKVFLTREESSNQPEVRRFGIDRDVVSNFSYLREKLQTVFPSLHGKNFAVHWKDADGDNIVITTDEELMIALTEMQTDVHKLYVTIKALSQPQQPLGGSAYPVHVGVTCDGCGKAVEGFRYKCVQCPDYDLCSNCENGNLHKEHFMIRVPVPISWRPYFGRRLAHHLSKSARKGGMTCENWGGEAQDGGPCPAAGGSFCPYPPRGHHGRHRGHGGHHQGLSGPNWLETLSTYLSEWTNLPGEADPQNANGSGTAETSEPQQEQQQHINFLKTVGQTVANLLDPLGIDVDVEVRTKNGTGEKITKSNEMNQDKNEKEKESIPTNKNVTFADDIHETVVKEVVGKVNDMTLSDNTTEESNRGAIPKSPAPSKNVPSSPESEGWTVVNETETQPIPPTTTPTPTGAVTAESSFYDAAHRAAMLGAQQAMAAHQTNMGPHQAAHEAAHRAALERATIQAAQQAREQAAYGAAYERAVWGAQQAMAASGNNNSIYPNLAHQAPPQEPQAPQQIPHHPQRHIGEAVQQMMSMGFTNEGGWLTQLVETQNGDIGKVFDILQPVVRK